MSDTLKLLINPRYWLVWLLIFIAYLSTYLPYRITLHLGKALGFLFYFVPSKIKTIIQRNIALCFPELTVQQQTRIIKKNFVNLGAGIAETAFAWWAPHQKLTGLLNVHGFHHVERELAAGRGVILLSQHFTCLELIGRLMAEYCSFNALYQPCKHKLFAYLLDKYRQCSKANYIANSNMRQVIKVLRAKQLVWYAYDVDGGKSTAAVFAPFLTLSASSLITVSKIAKFTNAAVIPTSFYRREDDTGYDVIFAAAVHDFPSQDLIADAARLNRVIETAIRHKVDQYLWLYKRFKTRPHGEKGLYD